MREIKFRGKRTDNGEMWYGDLSHHTTGKVFIKDIKKGINGTFEVVSSTIGQFTGLTDKNGKEIYEGDIVSLNKHLLGRYIVKYDIKNTRFSMYRDNYEQAGFNLETMKNYEVIGNIHDDLPLIKSTKE